MVVLLLDFLQCIISSHKDDDDIPVGCVSLGSSYWRELTRLGLRPKESVAIFFLPVGRATGSGWSHKIITEGAPSAFLGGGGLGKGRKVWEGSQKSEGDEKTVGGLGFWLLKGSWNFWGLMSTIKLLGR